MFGGILARWPVIHAILFYIVWFVAVSAVSKPGGEFLAVGVELGFVVVCLAASYARFGQRAMSAELYWVVKLTVLGFLIDGGLVFAGLISFPFTSAYCLYYPWWMLGMWGCFATAFSTSLAWLENRVGLQIAFGAIGGGLSLYAAQRLGAVSFPNNSFLTLTIVAIEWAIVMVVSFSLRNSSQRMPVSDGSVSIGRT